MMGFWGKAVERLEYLQKSMGNIGCDADSLRNIFSVRMHFQVLNKGIP